MENKMHLLNLIQNLDTNIIRIHRSQAHAAGTRICYRSRD